MFKIMIVEDDQTISGLIADNLKKWQFEPVVVTDFNAVFDDFLQETTFSLIRYQFAGF